MDIYDPIALALGIEPSIDIKNYPTREELEALHPPTTTYRGKGKNFREGWVTPEDTRQKLRTAMLAREQDPDWIAKKADMRANMSAAKKGKPSTFKGKKMTPEQRERCRQGQLRRYAKLKQEL